MRGLLLLIAILSYLLWALARYQLGRSLVFGSISDGPLVTTGLYAKFRNPIYLFGTISLTFYLLAICRPWYLCLLLILLPMQYVRMKREARALSKKFDEQYENYVRDVWI